MLFSSLFFLYVFLPLCVLIYFLCPGIKAKNTVLLVFSLVFYAWGEPIDLLRMVAVAGANWAFGRLIGRRPERKFLTLAVVFNLLCLGVFKYTGFLLENVYLLLGIKAAAPQIALPIGISFYTFQALSYTIDVYRGQVGVQKSFAKFLLYVSLFPQLIAGPIVRYTDIAAQLRERRTTLDDAAAGARRFVLGLAKKMLLANVLGELVSAYGAASAPTVLFTWLYAVAFLLQIYFDFSAYSDMAIGLARIFGFRLTENFNYPYCAASITEFWRRWHISLGSWFRDYLYIPLGGSRVGKGRLLLNLLIVWTATGLWHGAAWTFVLWGLFYAVLLIIEKLALVPVLQRHRVLGHCYTLLLVLLGFVLFDAPEVSAAFARIGMMFGFGGGLAGTEALYYLRSYAAVLILAALGATPLPKLLTVKLGQTRAGHAVLSVLEPLMLTALLVVCTAYLVDGSFNPFLYFRF